MSLEWWLEPIRGAKGGTTVIQPPPQQAPDPVEQKAVQAQTDVMRQQLALAQQQADYQYAMAPFLLSQGGYDVTPVDKSYQAQEGETVIPIGPGRYKLTTDPNADALADLNNEIAMASGARTLAGLKGELPVDPAVEQDLTRGRQELMEELRQRLGPGFETSDPGMRALAEFDRNANSIRYQVRTGELNTANAISLNQQGQMQRREAQTLNTLKSSYDTTPIAAQYGGAGALASNIVGMGQQNRQFIQGLGMQGIGMGMNKDAMEGEQMGNLVGGGMSLVGTVGGALIL
jgi:hypothetical protein